MEVIFDLYSSVFPEVKKLSDDLSKNMKEMGSDIGTMRMGWKVGEIKVTVNDKSQISIVKEKITKILEEKEKGKYWIIKESKNER